MTMAPVICQLIGTLSLVQSRETGHRNVGEMGTTFCLVCPHDFHYDPISFTLPSLICHCSISPSSLPYVAEQKTLTCFPLSREDGEGEEKKPTANPSILKFTLGVEGYGRVFQFLKIKKQKVFFLIQNTEFQVIMAFTNTFIFLYVVLIYFQLNILTTLNLYYH